MLELTIELKGILDSRSQLLTPELKHVIFELQAQVLEDMNEVLRVEVPQGLKHRRNVKKNYVERSFEDFRFL